MYIRDSSYLVKLVKVISNYNQGVGEIAVCGFNTVGDPGDTIHFKGYNNCYPVVIMEESFYLVKEEDMLAVYSLEEVWPTKKQEEVISKELEDRLEMDKLIDSKLE